jgi:hypothetical protein
MKTVHLQAPTGVIFYLTKENEKATKQLLQQVYPLDTIFTIVEAGETLALEDIFTF